MDSSSEGSFVQFGCGLCAPLTWENYDSSPTLRLQKLPLIGSVIPSGPFGAFPKNVQYGDIVKGLPAPRESASLLYCSHVLEHLSFADLRVALRNCHSILRCNGIFRLVLPDLEQIVQRYINSTSPDAAQDFMRATILGKTERSRTVRAFAREWFGGSHHLWMWDYKSLAAELHVVGFRGIRRAYFGDSGVEAFADVEELGRWEYALGIQCTK